MNLYTITVHRGDFGGWRCISAVVNGVDQGYRAKVAGTSKAPLYDLYHGKTCVAQGVRAKLLACEVYNHLATLHTDLKANY